MPLYTFECPSCEYRTRQFRKIMDRDKLSFCAVGHAPVQLTRVIEAPAVRADYAPYTCPVTGDVIAGRRAHEENLRKHGARVLEPGETQRNIKAQHDRDEAIFKKIDAGIDEEISKLSAPKREQLAVEMEKGLDVSYDRSTGKV